jgi:hypothetical protein
MKGMSCVASDAEQLSHDKDGNHQSSLRPHSMDLESHIISVLCRSQRRTMARYREVTPLGRWVGHDSEEEELDVFAAERYFNGDDARSSSSFRTGTTTHEHGRSSVAAATSSSEASWNSRFALLADGKKVPPVHAPGVVEAESCGTGSERPRENPPSSCHLRRWRRVLASVAMARSRRATTRWEKTTTLAAVKLPTTEWAG